MIDEGEPRDGHSVLDDFANDDEANISGDLLTKKPPGDAKGLFGEAQALARDEPTL